MADAPLDALVREVRALFNDGWDNPSDLRLRALLGPLVERADAFDLMEREHVEAMWNGVLGRWIICVQGTPLGNESRGPTLLDAVRAYREGRGRMSGSIPTPVPARPNAVTDGTPPTCRACGRVVFVRFLRDEHGTLQPNGWMHHDDGTDPCTP
jgi:hypothetical protein